MTTSKNRSAENLARLRDVYRMRLSAAKRKMQGEQSKLEAVEAELKERQEKVDVLEAGLSDLRHFLSGESDSLAPSAADYCRAMQRRYWLDFDRQRESYYLKLTHDEHREQCQVLEAARRHYRQLHQRNDVLDEQLRKRARDRLARNERRQEIERESRFRLFGSAGELPA